MSERRGLLKLTGVAEMENDLLDFRAAHRRGLTQSDLRIAMLMAIAAIVLVSVLL